MSADKPDSVALGGVQLMNEFLRHLRDNDLPDAELFELKARAFDNIAVAFERDGDLAGAEEARCFASKARERAAQ